MFRHEQLPPAWHDCLCYAVGCSKGTCPSFPLRWFACTILDPHWEVSSLRGTDISGQLCARVIYQYYVFSTSLAQHASPSISPLRVRISAANNMSVWCIMPKVRWLSYLKASTWHCDTCTINLYQGLKEHCKNPRLWFGLTYARDSSLAMNELQAQTFDEVQSSGGIRVIHSKRI